MGGLARLIPILATISLSHSLIHVYPDVTLPERDAGDAGKPLFLTPYVENGKVDEGRRLARVPITDQFNITSYSGYLTVNKTYNSNLFFWYFQAMNAPENAPVLLWLQGGPGGSSLFGLFTEHGPITVKKGEIVPRELTWARDHHVIYVDNPVGTGFSFTENDDDGYCTEQVQIGDHLYIALIQFFKLFPNLQKNNFFVAGESYGGKYVPSIGFTIYKRNPEAPLKINLKGLAIGNGLTDPEHQMGYSKFLYQVGLLDSKQAAGIKELEDETVEFIKREDWLNAFVHMMLHILHYGVGTLTGEVSVYNILDKEHNVMKDVDFGPVIQKTAIRKAIHVGEKAFNDRTNVYNNLIGDIMKSVAPWVSELLDHYQIMVYNGQLDIIVCYPCTVNYLNNLKFSSSEQYKNAKRRIWSVDGDIAGYVKVAGNLTEVMVRDAGHMVPYDQPKWGVNLITTFTHGNNF